MGLTALEFILRATGRATLLFFSHDSPPKVYGSQHYPVAQADAQTFPVFSYLNEIEAPPALAVSYDRPRKRTELCGGELGAVQVNRP
jgi:hypothetical protein